MIEGTVQPKTKIYRECSHPQASQDVDAFVSSSEQIFRIFWRNIAYSRTDPLQWMGAVRMRFPTADKNIVIIQKKHPHDSSQSTDILWSKKNKEIPDD